MSGLPDSDSSIEGNLLEKFKGTPEAKLLMGVKNVDGLTPEEADSHKRWRASQKAKVKDKLYSWGLHFLFGVFCLLVIIVACAAIYLTFQWVKGFVADQQKLGEFLSEIWNFVLVAFATLFVNQLISRD